MFLRKAIGFGEPDVVKVFDSFVRCNMAVKVWDYGVSDDPSLQYIQMSMLIINKGSPGSGVGVRGRSTSERRVVSRTQFRYFSTTKCKILDMMVENWENWKNALIFLDEMFKLCLACRGYARCVEQRSTRPKASDKSRYRCREGPILNGLEGRSTKRLYTS